MKQADINYLVQLDPLKLYGTLQRIIQDTDLKGILNFCKNFSVKNAYVVTKSLMEEREIEGIRVSFIPLWLFLLIF